MKINAISSHTAECMAWSFVNKMYIIVYSKYDGEKILHILIAQAFSNMTKTFKIQDAGNHSNMITAIVFKYCIIFILYLFQKRVCLVMQGRCYWSRCTNENDVACLLATQFVKNEGADQTQIETYFD